MTRDELIERVARARCEAQCTGCGTTDTRTFKCGDGWVAEVPDAELALSALCKAIPGLSDVLDGKAVIVPVDPTDEMMTAVSALDEFSSIHNYGAPPPAEAIYTAMIEARPK